MVQTRSLESGGADTFEVSLRSQPSADVTIDVASDAEDEGTTDVTSLTFTTANWNAPQIVTVTGENDPADDGNQPYTIELAAAVSADTGYDGLDPDDVSVTNVDDENPGFTVTVADDTTGEDGSEAAFTVVLVSAPTSTVTVAKTSFCLTTFPATSASRSTARRRDASAPRAPTPEQREQTQDRE